MTVNPTDRFVLWGGKVFAGYAPRVSFEPILYLFMLGVAARVTFTDELEAIPFREELTEWAEVAWSITSLTCPLLALSAWWLMRRSLIPGAALAGLRLRLGADAGQFTALLTFHIAAAHGDRLNEAMLYERYVCAGVLVYLAATVVRDVWSLVLTHRIAGAISERFG